MVKYPLYTLLLAALVAISSADAFSPRIHPTRGLSFLVTVNEIKHQPLPTKTFSTVDSTLTREEDPTLTEEDLTSTKEGEADSTFIEGELVEEVDSDEFKLYELPATSKPVVEVSLPAVASIFVTTLGTFYWNNVFNLGPVMASSIAGLVATMVLPEKLALAAFCGSFAGMARMAVIPGLVGGATLGVTCAAMMTLFDDKKWLVGVGGRLGFIAQCACTTQFLISSLFLAPVAPAALIGSGPLDFRNLAVQLPKVAGYTVAGALFMRLWKQWFADKSKRLSNSVGAVSATGLLAASMLPASIAGPIFCGSFVAMSAPTKLANTKALVLASLLAGAAQQSLAGVMLGGWGGKLGTAALMGVLAYIQLEKLANSQSKAAL